MKERGDDNNYGVGWDGWLNFSQKSLTHRDGIGIIFFVLHMHGSPSFNAAC
jgi:hypothetical protein